MKQETGIRIRVIEPPKGAAIQVQQGRCELLPPVKTAGNELVFEFPIYVDVSSGVPNFLGAYAQGPKSARFIYVNSGTYAGHADAPWRRRAKLSLMSISKEQIEECLASRSARLETSFPGTGKDGGPACASVKGLKWSVVRK